MPRDRGVPGFWLDIDALESARTQLIGRLGTKDGMMAYAIHVRLFTWQYRTARPVTDDAHVARLTGLDIRSCRRLWPEVRAEIGWIFDERSPGSYCRRTYEVLRKANRINILSGAGNSAKGGGDPDPDPDLKNLVHEDMYIPTGPETSGDALALASQGGEEQTRTKSRAINQCPAKAIMELYNEVLVPPLPEAQELTSGRRSAMGARWRNGLGDLETWRAYFTSVGESDFLTGQVAPGPGRSKAFRASLDWLLRESNHIKVKEGRYHG